MEKNRHLFQTSGPVLHSAFDSPPAAGPLSGALLICALRSPCLTSLRSVCQLVLQMSQVADPELAGLGFPFYFETVREQRHSSWAVRPFSASANGGARAWQAPGQRGGRCLRAAVLLLWGPGSRTGEIRDWRAAGPVTTPTPRAWGCPVPPGRQGGTAALAALGAWHGPSVPLTDYCSPHVPDEEAGNTAPASESGWARVRLPAAWLTPAVPTACSSQGPLGSTCAHGEARVSRPRGTGWHPSL